IGKSRQDILAGEAVLIEDLVHGHSACELSDDHLNRDSGSLDDGLAEPDIFVHDDPGGGFGHLGTSGKYTLSGLPMPERVVRTSVHQVITCTLSRTLL